MNPDFTTYVLKSSNDAQTNLFVKTLNFLSAFVNINNTVKTINTIDIQLNTDCFLILFLDELQISELTGTPANVDFFKQKKFNHNQIILILEEIEASTLPEFLQYFQTFELASDTYNDDNEIDFESVENNLQLINSKVFEVGHDIVHYIKRIKLPQPKKEPAIFIGPSDNNTTLPYQKIMRELLHRNYKISPELSNPSAKELLENENLMYELLMQSQYSIHFIGQKSIMDYPEKVSPALLINNITAKFCATEQGKNLKRIIYMPAINEDNDELPAQKLLQFKNDSKILLNAELIQTPIEKFKEIILHKFNEPTNEKEDAATTDEIVDDIYFIYPTINIKEIEPYFKWCDKNKIKYSKSQIDLDQLDLLQYNRRKLIECKGVIIYNAENAMWLNRKISDVSKAPGWGRNKPFKIKAVVGHFAENIAGADSFIYLQNIEELEKLNLKTLLTDQNN